MIVKGIIEPDKAYTLSALCQVLLAVDRRTAVRSLRETLDRRGVPYSILLKQRVYFGRDVIEGCRVKPGEAEREWAA